MTNPLLDKIGEVGAQAKGNVGAELEKLGVPAALLQKGPGSGSELWKMLLQTVVTPLTFGFFSFFVSGKVDKAQKSFMKEVQTQATSSAESARQQRTEEDQRRRREQQQQTRIAKQFWIWDQISRDLYDINCYVQALPQCPGLHPDDILMRKQRCDYILNAYRDFLPETVASAYSAFSESAFEVPKDPAAPVKLRASYRNRPPEKPKPKKLLFAYGADVEGAAAQGKVIDKKWEALRAAITQMLSASATDEGG